MIETAKILIDTCIYLNLSKQEATWVLRSLHTEEQRIEMLEWIRQNLEKHPKPIEVIIAACEIQEKHCDKRTDFIFDKDLEKRKSLIIVNSPSSAGTMKVARWNMADADNIGIAFLEFPFDAFTFPRKYTVEDIKAINAQNDFMEWWWLTDAFCEFLKVNLDDFDRIAVWHGDSTSELMFLYFFADYYRKPFYTLDVSPYVKHDRGVEPSFLHPGQLAKLYGKERLLTDEEVVNLRGKALNIKIGDTGYHHVNDEGIVMNVMPESYTDTIHAVLLRHGGELRMSRLVGELMGLELKKCSEHFIEKLIIHHLRHGLIKAFWVVDGMEITPNKFYFNIGHNPGPKDFCYSTVIVRLPKALY